MAENGIATFAAGEVVRLKCGGPNMVADEVYIETERPFARCKWFDRRGKLQTGSIALDALRRPLTGPPPA